MKVRIAYFPPFDSLVGQRSEEVYVEGSSITVLALLRMLTAKHPRLKSYVSVDSDEELRVQMSVVADSDLLKISDKIDEDGPSEVKILPPITGGAYSRRRRKTEK